MFEKGKEISMNDKKSSIMENSKRLNRFKSSISRLIHKYLEKATVENLVGSKKIPLKQIFESRNLQGLSRIYLIKILKKKWA